MIEGSPEVCASGARIGKVRWSRGDLRALQSFRHDDFPDIFVVVRRAEATRFSPVRVASEISRCAIELCNAVAFGEQAHIDASGDDTLREVATTLSEHAERLGRPLAVALAALPLDPTHAAESSISATLFDLRLRAIFVVPENESDAFFPAFFGQIVDSKMPLAAPRESLVHRLCARTAVDVGEEQLRLHHVCTNETFTLPSYLLEALRALAAGSPDLTSLTRAIRAHVDEDIDESDVADILEVLGELGILHANEPASAKPSRFLLERASRVVEAARADVRGYSLLDSNDVTDAPFLFASQITPRWKDFLRDDLRAKDEHSLGAHLHMRRSSGSTSGNGFLTVLERDAANERVHAETAIDYQAEARTVRVNRPTNLFEPAVFSKLGSTDFHCEKVIESPHLKVTFGENPTRATDDALARAIDAVIAFEPTKIEGDPSYIFALAQFCKRRKIELPWLRRIEVGHGFLWNFQRKIIRDVFRVPVIRRYHSSEAGTIAIDCDVGNLHLVESYALYEIIARGVDAEVGELGALAFTPLDSAVRPLIRYILGDAVHVSAASCRCGRPFRVIELEGRLTHLFRNDAGNVITQRVIDEALGVDLESRWACFTMRGDGPLQVTLVANEEGAVDSGLASQLQGALGIEVVVQQATHLEALPKVVTLSCEALAERRCVDIEREFLARR